FDPPADEQLAVTHETEVARPHEGAFVRAGDVRVELLLGLLGALPVAVRQPRTLHPDFAEFVWRATAVSLRIDDGDLSVDDGLAAADERARARFVRCDLDYAPFLFEH